MEPEKLVALREQHELTQAQMAERLGVHLATYQQWEYGRRKMNATARKLIEVLFPEKPGRRGKNSKAT